MGDKIKAVIRTPQRMTAAIGGRDTTPAKWKGEWQAEETYAALQKVSRAGSSYVCIKACVGVDPALDVGEGVEGECWLLIAKRGDQGAPFTFDMFTAAQLAALKGAKGVGIEKIEQTGAGCNTVPDEYGSLVTVDRWKDYRITFTDGGFFDYRVEGGADGPRGLRGAAFTYDDFTEEQLAALKGRPFTYEDFTPAQLEALRGPAGETINDISRTSGTGAPGTVDTYTVTTSTGRTWPLYLYNGKDGGVNIPGGAEVGQIIQVAAVDGNGKPTAWEVTDKPSGPYLLLNLAKYGISSDCTNAEATTNGINQAIADAVENGYSTIVFPKGEYLISGDGQINITGRLTVDFNNSVLRKEPNANESYVMVEISGDHNVVKNATLYGDRETHDFSSGGTHEWGIGIDITADSRFTVVENVDIFDTTGYGIKTSVMHNQIEPIRNRPLEAGCYDTSTGELVASTTHTVLGYTLDITDSAIKNDMFILGGNGYCAHGIAEPLTFYMSFYDENETYIGFSRAYRLYDNIDLKSLLYWYPALRYIKFSIENTDTETNVTLELRSSYTSDDITIKNCEIARCRTLGIAITGGKRIEVENVSIHDIGGAAPGYGVDIEDGYQLNQYIVFRSCEFYNNKYGDIVIVKARDILVENCRFQGFQRSLSTTDAAAIAIGGGSESVTSKFEVRSSVFTGTSVGGKNIVFHNCILLRCEPMSGNFTECRFYGGIMQSTEGTTLKSCYLNGVRVAQRGGNWSFHNTVFENGCSFVDENLAMSEASEWWVMEGCTINDATVTPRSAAPYIRIANNKFYRNSESFKCVLLSTLQKTYLHITGNTFEQAGRIGLVHLKDTYGSEVVMEGNVFKSTGASDIGPYQPRAYIICTGLVTVSDNLFDTAYLSGVYGVLHLENCAKTIVTNNKFLGGYVLPIKMVTVTETLCDGNDYTGTPVLADTRTGVDIPDACGKSYVDSLIGDVNTVIASINALVGGV